MMLALNLPLQFISMIMECVETASYSLVLNGEVFGHFKGGKGLRQGDPLSPLLSTIAMEYLSRVLQYTTTSMPFKHHPLCSKLMLSHLMFADDLLLFSKGDTDSIMVAGFTEGQLPFRYLGVPITCGRMKKCDCNILVEKLIARIRSFGSRKLSYAGRLLLKLLVDGSADYIRVPLVSWEKVCSPKHEGGLGIRDSLAWNYATFGKLVWWIYCCPNRLWVRWVNQIYLKGSNWTDYTPSGDISWGWKNVCRVRDMLVSGYSNGQWILGTKGYSVSQGYELLRNKFQSMVWANHIWNNWCIPKHQFVGWLIQMNALQLKGKLFRLGIVSDDLCVLCSNAYETVDHLFQECEYSRRLLELFAQKCGLRNKARVKGCILRPELVFKKLIREMNVWLKAKTEMAMDIRDRVWFNSLQM
ncbi:uncharacterized protein LOC141651290 [Silene latifolia]|uniref:uncharacterized protein LOC141651290 n=1 Tax=Silene latifolia TaxID=37657 RepID=UPI003D77B0E6